MISTNIVVDFCEKVGCNVKVQLLSAVDATLKTKRMKFICSRLITIDTSDSDRVLEMVRTLKMRDCKDILCGEIPHRM